MSAADELCEVDSETDCLPWHEATRALHGICRIHLKLCMPPTLSHHAFVQAVAKFELLELSRRHCRLMRFSSETVSRLIWTIA